MITKQISLKIVQTVQELVAIENIWETLRTDLGNRNLCLSWLWCKNWCDTFLQPQDKLAIHCYFKQGKLVAIFPVYQKKITLGYQLRFVATGEDQQEEICSEFQDFLILPDLKNELLIQFSTAINIMPRIISLAFDNVLPNSIVDHWFNNYSQYWYAKKILLGQRYVFTVPLTPPLSTDIFKSKTTQRQARKYLSLANCYCEHLSSNQSIDAMYTDLVKLHNKSWHMRGKRGVFDNERFRQFHYKFAQQAHHDNKLVMFKIVHNKQTFAVFYGMLDGNVLHYYQSGILREDNLLVAGTAMHFEALRYAQQHNIVYYDLMKGKFDSYKQRLVAGEQHVQNLVAYKKIYAWLPKYWQLKNKMGIKNV